MNKIFRHQLSQKLEKIIESNIATVIITVLILINAIILGLETDVYFASQFGDTLNWIDKFILVLFSIELTIKLYVYRLKFFNSGWNIFDLTIVIITLFLGWFQ